MPTRHEPFYILSVDGGGFRGLFAAHLLKRIEENWEVNWPEKFNMFAGTSTGAILAAGLATGQRAHTLLDFYRRHGKGVFRRQTRFWCGLGGFFSSRYRTDALKSGLRECLPDLTLGSIHVPLLMPSVDIGNGCVHVLKSGYDPEFTRDKSVPLVDAVLSSCSAPTYFDPHDGIAPYQLADGGLWANNPSLAAFIDAQVRCGRSPDSIRILSIGTGTGTVFYPKTLPGLSGRLIARLQGWGLCTRWKRKRLLDLILNLQSENTHNMLLLLLREDRHDPKQILRLTFRTDTNLELDNVHTADDLLGRADKTFTHHAAKIAAFLQLGEHAE